MVSVQVISMASHTPPAPSQWAARHLYLLLAAIAFFVAIPGLFMGLHADDWFQVRPRPIAQSLATFAGDWNEGGRGTGGFYRPFSRLTFAVDEIVHGSSAAGCHFTNGIIFVVAILGLFYVCQLLCQGASLGTLAAVTALVVLNPLKNEALYWVSGRTDLLAAMFTILAVAFALRALQRDSPPQALAALLFLLGGLFSKEVAISGCGILPLAALMFAPAKDGSTRARAMLIILPMGFGAAYLCFRGAVLGGIAGYHVAEPHEFARLLGNIARIFSALSCPYQAYPALTFSIFWAATGLLFSAAILAFTGFRRAPVFALLSSILSALPMATISISPVDGMRVLFLPLLFFTLFLITAFCDRGFFLLIRKVFVVLAVAFSISVQFANMALIAQMIGAGRINDRIVAAANAQVDGAADGSLIVIPEGRSLFRQRILDPGATLYAAVQTHWLREEGHSSAYISDSSPAKAAILLTDASRSIRIAPNLQPWMRDEVDLLHINAMLELVSFPLERTAWVDASDSKSDVVLPPRDSGAFLVHAIEQSVPAGSNETPLPVQVSGTGAFLPPLTLVINDRSVTWMDTTLQLDTPTTATLLRGPSPLHESFSLRSIVIAPYRIKISKKDAKANP
ncbi:hypothetical protein IT570_12845 [Candidatus Sumerlaeota bacterium]|nr:hypothetical protein [Candidatus Sumerlaeota bacterium]